MSEVSCTSTLGMVVLMEEATELLKQKESALERILRKLSGFLKQEQATADIVDFAKCASNLIMNLLRAADLNTMLCLLGQFQLLLHISHLLQFNHKMGYCLVSNELEENLYAAISCVLDTMPEIEDPTYPNTG